MNLIIVESPTKARTLSRFLGKEYRIEATYGHIRDLPKDRLGVDINHDFEPDYIVPKEKKKIVEKLKKILRNYDITKLPAFAKTSADAKALADRSAGRRNYDITKLRKKDRNIERHKDREKISQYRNILISRIILATDLDREGEAIAWHVREILFKKNDRTIEGYNDIKKDKNIAISQYRNIAISRIVFHEITRQAIDEALKHPREIDMNLVNAQQGRRVLDRLVGYKLSPLLWYKTGKNWLSAGRVQSVAVRLIVEREREIEAFVPSEYWVVEVELRKQASSGTHFSSFVKGISKEKGLKSLAGGKAVEVWQDEHTRQLAANPPETSILSSHKNLQGANSLRFQNGSLRRLLGDSFLARLTKIDDKKAEIRNKEEAERVVAFLEKAFYKVQSVKKDIRKNYPPPPFITSTLQRAGANLFGWPARKTMIIAQNLYEQGAITYHRTDSVQLSKESLVMVRDYINKIYGKEYLPPVPRIYKTKSKLAQEAHEAIRPTSWEIPNSKFQIPNKSQISKSKIPNELGKDHQKLLGLISKRFIACQMREEEEEITKVLVLANGEVSQKGKGEEAGLENRVRVKKPVWKLGEEVSRENTNFLTSKPNRHPNPNLISNFQQMLLEAKGERQVFDGWRRIYDRRIEGYNDIKKNKNIAISQYRNIAISPARRPVRQSLSVGGSLGEGGQYRNIAISNKGEEGVKLLPPLSEGEALDLVKILPQQKFTQPPARYNEASLIKALEEKGIGRPSTYAPIISTIQARQYVQKEERAFKPTELGLAVNDFLVANFGKTINVEFTAKMEDKLDEIAKGKLKWVGVVGEFWQPFEKKLLKVKSQKSKVKIELEEVDEKCPKDGGQLVVRIGKYGKFLACGNFPKCRFTKPLVEKTGIKCPKCGGEVVLKKSKKGRRFYGCSNYPECNFASWRKP